MQEEEEEEEEEGGKRIGRGGIEGEKKITMSNRLSK